jgi:hypothetical protein
MGFAQSTRLPLVASAIFFGCIVTITRRRLEKAGIAVGTALLLSLTVGAYTVDSQGTAGYGAQAIVCSSQNSPKTCTPWAGDDGFNAVDVSGGSNWARGDLLAGFDPTSGQLAYQLRANAAATGDNAQAHAEVVLYDTRTVAFPFVIKASLDGTVSVSRDFAAADLDLVVGCTVVDPNRPPEEWLPCVRQLDDGRFIGKRLSLADGVTDPGSRSIAKVGALDVPDIVPNSKVLISVRLRAFCFTQFHDGGSCSAFGGNTATIVVEPAPGYEGNIPSAALEAARPVDTTPPDITAHLTPSPNQAGWNTTPVRVAWTVNDPESEITSSLGCETVTLTGETAATDITCTAVNAANLPMSRTITIRIDRSPPAIGCRALPDLLWPANHTLVAVSSAVSVEDALSGAAGFTLASVVSSEPDNGLGDGDTAGDIQGFTLGTPGTNGWLRAERSGTGTGRRYTFTYVGADKAGNSAACSAIVTVPRDPALLCQIRSSTERSASIRLR